MPDPSNRHVFVYGTLRQGDVRDITRLHPAPQFVGRASVAGDLYDLGPYPGMRLGGEGRVQGEVYAISEALERRLDEIEEVWPQQTGEYTKRKVLAQLDDAVGAQPIACLTYEIDPARTVGKPLIAHGDWLKR